VDERGTQLEWSGHSPAAALNDGTFPVWRADARPRRLITTLPYRRNTPALSGALASNNAPIAHDLHAPVNPMIGVR